MENLELFFYLVAIFELITLICFFVLCANVASIRKKLKNNGAAPTLAFSMFIAMGNIDKAKEILLDMIFADENIKFAINTSASSLKVVMSKYHILMKKVGLDFDAEEAFKTKQLF